MYLFFIFSSNEPIIPKIKNSDKKLTNNIGFNFLLNKNNKNKPKKNKIKGILFPENNMPRPKIHIISIFNKNPSLFLNVKNKKIMEKRKKFFI